jgi:hypothetical protein
LVRVVRVVRGIAYLFKNRLFQMKVPIGNIYRGPLTTLTGVDEEEEKKFATRHLRKPKNGYPLLRGRLENEGTIRVWCPFCQKSHIHGWPTDNPSWAVEHRVARFWTTDTISVWNGLETVSSGVSPEILP